MKNELMTPFQLEFQSTLKNTSNDDLYREFQVSIQNSYSNLQKAAFYYQEIKRRGLEAPELKPALVNVFYHINSQRILPELASRYLGSLTLINYISHSLPLEAQEKLVEDDKVDVVVHKVIDGKNVFVTEKLQLEAVRNNLLPRIFGAEGFRSIEQQKEFAIEEFKRKEERDKSSSKSKKAITIFGRTDLSLNGHRLQLKDNAIDLNVLFSFLGENGFEVKLKK